MEQWGISETIWSNVGEFAAEKLSIETGEDSSVLASSERNLKKLPLLDLFIKDQKALNGVSRRPSRVWAIGP
jgi:hypothetical protein